MSNDICVICGNDTGVAQDTPIQDRKRYVSGSGQLCRECYYDLYLKPNSGKNVTSTESEMKWLLKMSRKE